MAAGFLFNNICYPTLSAATSAHWSANPVSMTAGTTSYISDMVWSGTAWVINKYTMTTAGVLTLNSTTNAPVLAFEACDTKTDFLDGMTLGWGVAVAMVAAFAIKFLAERHGI